MCLLCHNHDHPAGFGNNHTHDYTNTDALEGGLEGPSFLDASTLQQQAIATLNGSSWGNGVDSSAGAAINVTYSFDGPWGSGGTGNQGGAISQVNAANQLLVKDFLDNYAAVANVTFAETNNGSDADMAMRSEDMSHTGVGGYAYLPGGGVGGNITYDTEFDNGPNGGANDKFGQFAMIHEIGHAMGLYHTFAGSPGQSKPGGLTGNYQSAEYSVMGYRDGTNVSRSETTGLQLLDVFLLQHKYGKNFDHESGDTVYKLGDTALVEAVWDGGGNDTFDASSQSSSVTLDLRDGDFLNTAGAAKVRIAYEAEIENAIGGSGADSVRGNGLENYLYGGDGGDTIHGDAGNDVLFGGKDQNDATDAGDLLLGGEGEDIIFGNGGNDTIIGGDDYEDSSDANDVLFGGVGDDQIYGNGGDDELIGASGVDSLYGGAGDDVYVVGWGNDADLIYGFEGAGQSGGDAIRILQNVNDSGITDFTSLMDKAVDDGTHTYFDLGGGNGVLVANVTKDGFEDGDFEFV